MLIQSSVTTEYRQSLSGVGDGADAELQSVMTEIQRLPEAQQKAALHDVLPALGGRFADATSQVSTVFFDALMELQEVRRPVPSALVAPYDDKVWHALIGWAFSPDKAGQSVLERGGTALLYSLLSGGMSRILSEVGADTMIGNAGIQSQPMRSQRVPSAGCCSWCGMLASRFAEYTSEGSAGKVVGRGVPVGEGKGRGLYGKGMGLRPRGARELGEDYHDHCKCSIVIVTEKNEVQLQAQADKYYDSYRDAADKVNSGLTLQSNTYELEDGTKKNKYEWVKVDGEVTTPKSRTNDIVNSMRRDLKID